MLQIIFRTLMADFHIQVKCQLYYVNYDIIFSYHKASEIFAAHDGNQLMTDAPVHHLFVLLVLWMGWKTIYQIYCVYSGLLRGTNIQGFSVKKMGTNLLEIKYHGRFHNSFRLQISQVFQGLELFKQLFTQMSLGLSMDQLMWICSQGKETYGNWKAQYVNYSKKMYLDH